MNAVYLWILGGCGLALAGLCGFVLLEHLLRRIIAFNIMGSGAFLLVIGLARESGPERALPEVLVLAGIVVAVTATAQGLYLLRRWFRLSGRTDLPHIGH